MPRVLFNECLRYTMVYILHPTVFSLTDSLKSSSCRRCLPYLKLSAKFTVMRTFLLDGPAGYKTGPMLTVVCGSDKVDASVDTDNITDIRLGNIRHIAGDRDMQEIPPMPFHQSGCAELICVGIKVFLHPAGAVGEFQPSCKGIDGKTVFIETVIPIPYEVVLLTYYFCVSHWFPGLQMSLASRYAIPVVRIVCPW